MQDTAVKRARQSAYSLVFKRAIDIAVSFVAIVLAGLPMLVVAVIVRTTSRGPVIFRQKRLGKDGKVFTIYKFRTMVDGADDLKKSLSAKELKEFTENFKLENDPRVTKIGAILRKTSMDELPQLFNVFAGEMSLIGPRPVVPDEIEKFGEHKNAILSVTPGLTGYWACSGRSDVSYDERVALELYYVENVSVRLDFRVFVRTILAVLKSEGAK